MRVVDVNEYYSPTGGGVRTYLDRKMEIMAELGHELIVIAPGRADAVEERPGGGCIHWVKAPRLILDTNYGIFVDGDPIRRLLDRLDADVVETSSPWRPGWIVGNWQGGALKVFFAHNDNVAAYPMRWFERFAAPDRIERAFGWYTRYMARFLAKFDVFVTNGPSLAKRHARRGLTVHAAMPLGIQRGIFSPEHRDEGLRRALLAQCDLPPDAHLLLGIGRHHPEKRWPMIFDAVERAGAQMPVGLIQIGAGVDSRVVQRRVAGSPHIKLFRPVYDRQRLARIMASCDALIHGSDAEPFGLVGLEAIASGLPLIAPDEGGFAELADPLFAETYRARDARSAAAAIRRLFTREPRILRAAARHAAGQVRTDRDHAIALIDYYQSLLDARRRPRLAA
ncbi:MULTISPECIES: glycosyltransferase [unclassified Sphingomonas]|uniref:glycosyltransferase n=1 Tax=unclassified Sphingomonas TaxID=196159 RepID=UPI00082BB0DA|nr:MULTISPECIES: glycosyltransferase [unclassified Sphingomonas]MCH4893939.1 glycosyltransferase [Sphingomonas sp. SFZ2018-12]